MENNSETFQRGEWVEVRDSEMGDWVERIFLMELPNIPFPRPYMCVVEGDSSKFSMGRDFSIRNWKFIRKIQQPQQPKKTVLKAPAIVNFGKRDEVTSGLYTSKLDALKVYPTTNFISFPAKIRMKDGTNQELWFVCEEE